MDDLYGVFTHLNSCGHYEESLYGKAAKVQELIQS